MLISSALNCGTQRILVEDNFKLQPTLHAESISVRPLESDDFDELYSCASDKQIWAGHPHPTRYQLSEFRAYFQSLINSKACIVVVENSTGKIIGASRYYQPASLPGSVSIGFTFLVRKHWGGSTNYNLKKLMLDYAFEYFDTVWFHVAPTNIRSQKATLKLGATFTQVETLNISGKEEPWYCYKIENSEWFSLAAQP